MVISSFSYPKLCHKTSHGSEILLYNIINDTCECIRLILLQLYKGANAMAHHYAGFLLIMAEDLPKTPKAFQEYVERYFEESQFKGSKCFIAITADSDGGGDGNQKKGVAPSHSVNLAKFKDGLPKGESLSGWIRKEAKKEEGVVLSFDASWSDGCIESLVGY